MENKEWFNLISLITEAISDRNSCLTQLAKARLQIIISIDKMSINDMNDINGNKFKLKELKEQAEKIDELIKELNKKY